MRYIQILKIFKNHCGGGGGGGEPDFRLRSKGPYGHTLRDGLGPKIRVKMRVLEE